MRHSVFSACLNFLNAEFNFNPIAFVRYISYDFTTNFAISSYF